MGDTLTESDSLAWINSHRSGSVRATAYTDCQDQASSTQGLLHQPSSSGLSSAVLPSLSKNLPGSDWPVQPPSNPPCPLAKLYIILPPSKIVHNFSEDGHLLSKRTNDMPLIKVLLGLKHQARNFLDIYILVISVSKQFATFLHVSRFVSGVKMFGIEYKLSLHELCYTKVYVGLGMS